MHMIDADKLTVREVTVRRKLCKGGKPWWEKQRIRVVTEGDVERAKLAKPRNRLERIQRMDAGEMARFLMKLTADTEGLQFCQMLDECLEADLDEIPDEKCSACMERWLLEDGDVEVQDP